MIFVIVEPRIKAFEKLGFGMFVHFGVYSVLGKGEWSKYILHIPEEEYDLLPAQFDPDKDWAEKLVAAAKGAGCKYITLTTRHHDGFSLYDTCGLNTYDAPHAKCGRDLVKEFVDACNAEGIIPFFYHTLLDWHEKTYNTDFSTYLKYLRESVKLLCTNYGKIGGIWFDGKWNKPNDDWEEDLLYGMIREYQPDAMIINNTGLSERGKLGHIELDSVTFERGRPGLINLADSPKYVASEMCQTMGDTWGYGADDLYYKSPVELITDLCVCRKFGANLLLNVGPKGNGLLRDLDVELLKCMGRWVQSYGESIYAPRPSGIEVMSENDDFILCAGDAYYLFCHNVGMSGDGNVVPEEAKFTDRFAFEKPIKKAVWMDNDADVKFEQENGEVVVHTMPFAYGGNLVVRVAKIEV